MTVESGTIRPKTNESLEPQVETTKVVPLGAHAARGAAWSLLQTAGSKFFGIAAQVALGFLLIDKSMGIAAAALTVAGFASLTQRFGMTEILVQRHQELERWERAAFFISLTSGIFSAVLTVSIAPLANWYYGSSTFGWLLALMAISIVGDSLCTCPAARLQVGLRFRDQSLVGVGSNVLIAALTIGFALLGFGPFAIILPRPIATWAQAFVLWKITHNGAPRGSLNVWRGLIGDGAAVAFAGYLGNVIQSGDYLALSLFHPLAVVGIYFFGYNMSTQMVQILAANLGASLFTLLSKLKDEPHRQAEAFLRASRALCLFVMPLCLLQAVLAKPVLHLLWGHKWDGSIVVLQILSVGMAFTVTAGVTNALMQAQGRFRFLLAWQVFVATIFLASVITGALIGGAVSVALAVCLFCIMLNSIGTYLALRPARIRWITILPIYIKPLYLSALAISGGVFARWFCVWTLTHALSKVSGFSERLESLLTCVIVGGISCALYTLLVRIISPADALVAKNSLRLFTARFSPVSHNRPQSEQQR